MIVRFGRIRELIRRQIGRRDVNHSVVVEFDGVGSVCFALAPREYGELQEAMVEGVPIVLTLQLEHLAAEVAPTEPPP